MTWSSKIFFYWFLKPIHFEQLPIQISRSNQILWNIPYVPIQGNVCMLERFFSSTFKHFLRGLKQKIFLVFQNLFGRQRMSGFLPLTGNADGRENSVEVSVLHWLRFLKMLSRRRWINNCYIVKISFFKYAWDLWPNGVQKRFLDEEGLLLLCDCYRSANNEYSYKGYERFHLPPKS